MCLDLIIFIILFRFIDLKIIFCISNLRLRNKTYCDASGRVFNKLNDLEVIKYCQVGKFLFNFKFINMYYL